MKFRISFQATLLKLNNLMSKKISWICSCSRYEQIFSELIRNTQIYKYSPGPLTNNCFTAFTISFLVISSFIRSFRSFTPLIALADNSKGISMIQTLIKTNRGRIKHFNLFSTSKRRNPLRSMFETTNTLGGQWLFLFKNFDHAF